VAKEMRRIDRFVFVIFIVATLAGCASKADLDSNKGACYLKATRADVYLKVFDLNPAGSMGPLIWQGRISQGETIQIKSPHAYFRYYYNLQPGVDRPLSSGLDRTCDNLEIVSVP